MAEMRDDTERGDDEIAALLRHVDHPPPRIKAEEIIARAKARDLVWLRRAAVAVLALGVAGAAYAATGSTIRGWLRIVVERIEGPPSPAPEVAPAGIAVAPGERLLIVFTSVHAGGEARVSLTQGAEVVVRAPNGSATFTSEADRLVIDNSGPPASFDIEIPSAAPRVEIRVAGTRVLLKEGTRITTDGSSTAPGVWLVPLTP